MKYRIVQSIEDAFIASEVTEENLGAWLDARGFTVVGVNSNKRQRAELQGQPIVAELVGPMWDGDAIRYEDTRTNDFMST